ncbi:MAG TPA: hypothetical protein VLI39_07600 [Sedimentisphaerales bacterium]|nr:hypothetical protein [Sedimentisphaerales bacterium]
MIVDKDNMMSDAQALTTSGSVASTSYIDLGTAAGFKSSNAEVVVSVQTAFTSSGAPTLAVTLETDTSSDFATAKTTIGTSATGIVKANLTAGTTVARMKIPPNCKRYLRVMYTIGVADYTAGNMDAFVVIDSQTAKDAINT